MVYISTNGPKKKTTIEPQKDKNYFGALFAESSVRCPLNAGWFVVSLTDPTFNLKSRSINSELNGNVGTLSIASAASSSPSELPDSCSPLSVGHQELADRIHSLRAELAELAFTLDRRGNPSAADVASQLSARLNEWTAEFGTSRGPKESNAIAPNFVRKGIDRS